MASVLFNAEFYGANMHCRMSPEDRAFVLLNVLAHTMEKESSVSPQDEET